MTFSKLMPIQTLAVSLAVALGLLAIVALVGVGQASAQEEDWTGVAEFSVDADVIQGALSGEPAASADARLALQQVIDSATVRISVAADGTRQQQVLWNNATLLDLRADVSELPVVSHTPGNRPDPADLDPFELPVAFRLDLAVAMQMAEDLGLPSRAGAEAAVLEDLGAAGGEDARVLRQDLLPLLGTALTGGWIVVEGPFNPDRIPGERSTQDTHLAVQDVIADHVVVTAPDTDQSLQEWQAAIDVPGLVADLCSLAAVSASGQDHSCDEHADVPLLQDGEAVVLVSVDETADPIELFSDVSPAATLSWDQLFEFARQMR